MALRTKRVAITESCPICSNSAEDILHALIKCPGAKEVWRTLSLGDISALVNSFGEWWLQVLQNRDLDVVNMTTMIVWNLWNNRNNLVWNNKSNNAYWIISLAVNNLSQWQHARIMSNSQRRMTITNISTRWTKPEARWHKCNVDAAVFSHDNCIGIGCIVRDEDGRMVTAKNSKVCGDVNSATAEAISCRKALSWLKYLGFNKVIIESNAQVVVQAMLSAKEVFSYFGFVIEDCKSFVKDLGECVFVFTKRSANQMAHTLAKAAGSVSDQGEWTVNPPPFLINVLAFDDY